MPPQFAGHVSDCLTCLPQLHPAPILNASRFFAKQARNFIRVCHSLGVTLPQPVGVVYPFIYSIFSKLSEKERQCEKSHIQTGFQLPHIKPVIRRQVRI